MKPSLLATKFYRPAPSAKQVERQHLIRRMNEGLEIGHLLTLVSAPAGFGKTACVNAWISQLDRPSVWLSLDAADDDPGRFFTYFTAGLKQVDDRLGKEVETALFTGQLPPPQTIASVILHAVLGSDRAFVFVLDDFQVLQDSVILGVLGQVIANQPRQIHFVFATREDPLLPLSRLRANNLLTEVRSSDLRFSRDEIDQFFRDVMNLPLTPGDITSLETSTEGWIAGLQLAGLSIQGRKDPSVYISRISGSHRHIVSYLTEEVLNRQSEEVQEFLLQTSILETLNGDLCDAVCSFATASGHPGGSAMLERLLHENLFLIPLDDEQRWYRYHHLFADLLRTQLNRAPVETIRGLHQRASRWYAQAGMEAEAIEHAIAAGDFRQAVDLMERHAMSIVMLGHVKTVERWFTSIPEEWHRQSPRASLALAGMYLLRGNYPLVERYLGQSEAILASSALEGEADALDRASLRSEWLAIKSNLLNVQGSAAESLEMAQKALQTARLEDYYIQGIAYLGMGGAYRLMDDYPGLVSAYQKAIHNSRVAEKPLPEMLSTTALALMAIQHGELRFAEDTALQVIRRVETSGEGLPPVAGSIYGALGAISYEWNRLDQARELYQKALALSQLGGHNAGIVYARILRSRLDLAAGDLAAAAEEIRQAADQIPLGIPAWLKPEYLLQQVRVDLLRGNIAAFRALLDGLEIDRQADIPAQSEIVLLAFLHFAVYEARENNRQDDLPRAVQTASRLVDSARRGGRMRILLPALLLRAQMRAALGDRPAGVEDVSLAIELAEPEGYIRTFLDAGGEITGLLRESLQRSQPGEYAARLLQALPSPTPGESPTPARPGVTSRLSPAEARQTAQEPLTERELEVLRLIAEGLKYDQIAEKLVISINTVRFYVKEIYSKLQVNSRTQAVAAAQQMGLL